MNISLTPELDTYVHDKVKTGMYHSASEVIREGLRLLKEQDELKYRRLAQLGKEMDVAIEQIERGEFSEFAPDELQALADDVKSDGRRRLAKRKAA